MDLLASAFKVLMGMPRHFSDTETEAERMSRMHVLSLSIDRASKRAACVDQPADCKPIFGDRRMMMALLLAKGRFETDFAEHVHEGHCDQMPAGQRCDADKQGVARAHGPWQQWRSSVFPASDWDEMNSSSQAATDLAAWHAAKLLSGGTHRCAYLYPDPMASTIAAFSGSCIRMTPAMVQKQAKAVWEIASKLTDASS